MGIIGKLAEKFSPLFNKIKGGYFGILITIFGLITIITCIILYSLSEPISIFSHWISDLGGYITNSGASPNGANIIFSIGLIIISILAIPFLLYLTDFLLSKNQKLKFLVFFAFIFSIMTLLGIFGVAFIDIKSEPIIHTAFAALFFLGGMTIMFFFSLAMLFNSDVSNKQAIFGLICSAVPLAFLASFTPYMLDGQNVLTLVLSVDPALGVSRFLEWMYLIALFIWFFEIGFYLIKND